MGVDIEFTSKLTVRRLEVSATDAMVVEAARVSFLGEQSIGSEESAGLINFLMRNRHGTPFEHNHFKFFIAAPIFVFREFHRHRIGWSYNEESGRYKQLEPKFYVPAPERDLVQVGKPGAYSYVPGSVEQHALVMESLQEANRVAYEEYERMLANDIAKEVARMCLPVNIFSSMYATCNARSLMAFLSLRKKLNAEEAMFPSTPMKEINIIADLMEKVFDYMMPLTYHAFVQNRYVCP